MFQLIVKSGTNKGTTWLLSDTPLVIGRSADCDIVIPDSIVSRRHCELRLEGDTAYIRDTGSSNATLVNGNPVEDHPLKVGDEIAIGPYAFLFSAAAPDPVPPPSLRTEPETPLTVSLSNALYLKKDDRGSDVVWLPRSVYEFRDLFLLTRQLSLAGTTAELLEHAAALLMQRYQPEGLWFAWVLPEHNDLVFYPLEGGRQPADGRPLESMRMALDKRAGLLTTNYLRGKKPSKLETILAAPLILGEKPVGALAMRGVTPSRIYEENDLEFVVAVADTLAPYLVAVGRGEQMRRDLNGLSKRAGYVGQVVGSSRQLEHIRELMERAAATDLSVLILGETGVGKELAARSIHDHSGRAQRPFVTVNCASIPRELLESELFGHEKGAFTGAVQRRVGRFEEAHSGTLFLDEIGDLSLGGQVAILRAVETGVFQRVGSNQDAEVNVRIVAATNRVLADDVTKGRFRSDLYHRLSGFEIRIPPLRERKDDIPALAEFFLQNATASQRARVSHISKEAMERLRAWHWPGNIRELRLCIERATVLAQGPTIGPEHLVMHGEAAPPQDPEGPPSSLAQAEKGHICATLAFHNGNIRAAARSLSISRATLYAKMKRHGIAP